MKLIYKNQSGFSVVEILLVLILVSIIGFAGYYVSTQDKTAKTDTAASAAGKNATTNQNPDETANWQSEVTQDFTVKIPKTWKFYAIGDNFPIGGDDGKTTNTAATNNYIQDSSKGVGSIAGTISSETSTLDPAAYLEQVFPNGQAPQGQITDKKSFTVNGYKAETYTLKAQGTSYKIAISNGKTMLYVDYASEDAPTLDKVVQTIKIK